MECAGGGGGSSGGGPISRSLAFWSGKAFLYCIVVNCSLSSVVSNLSKVTELAKSRASTRSQHKISLSRQDTNMLIKPP